MDCTFKTNKFRMPLFNIVGCILLHITFFLAFVLTNSRAEEAFTWVFERLREVYTDLKQEFPRTLVIDNEKGIITFIREVFPEAVHLFCIWYIKKDVKAWARKKFTELEDLNKDTSLEEVSGVIKRKLNEFLAHWISVINAPTEIAFDEIWNNFTVTYVETFPAVIFYFEDTWLRYYKEKFCQPWIRWVLYFGNIVTNRGEKSHDVINDGGCCKKVELMGWPRPI